LRPDRPIGDVTAAWLKANPASMFFPAGESEFPPAAK
jgi:hypothetical protein